MPPLVLFMISMVTVQCRHAVSSCSVYKIRGCFYSAVASTKYAVASMYPASKVSKSSYIFPFAKGSFELERVYLLACEITKKREISSRNISQFREARANIFKCRYSVVHTQLKQHV